MAQIFPMLSNDVTGRARLGSVELEALFGGEQAAGPPKVHPETLQKMLGHGETHGTLVGKPWRFRTADLDTRDEEGGHDLFVTQLHARTLQREHF
jgi:hypothetical protein